MLLRVRLRLVSTALLRSASAIAAAPSPPMPLLQRFKSVNTSLTASALPIATPPSRRMSLRLRSMVVNTALSTITARRAVGRSPPSFPHKLSESPPTPAARFSPFANGSPISAPSASVFAQLACHVHGGAPERVTSSQNAQAAKYSWKERCDDCSCSGSACSKLSSGNSSRATRLRNSASASRNAPGRESHADRTSAAHSAIARPSKAVSSRPDERKLPSRRRRARARSRIAFSASGRSSPSAASSSSLSSMTRPCDTCASKKTACSSRRSSPDAAPLRDSITSDAIL
mmetsp:Transcript_11261/g.33096  ORF Transcript_11261/g.33096 Transcript_11261/m.33096 type:complete len:288 (-) Transcript_11261:1544-2407(-)